MGRVTRETRFICTDGEAFEKCLDAERHQAGLDFRVWYEGDGQDNKLDDPYTGKSLDFKAVQGWVDKNAAVLQAYLEGTFKWASDDDG